MHSLPGIGIFGTNDVVRVLVPILREKGFVIAAIWGKNMKEAEDIAKDLKISFFTNKIDDVLLCKNVDMIFVLCQPYLHPQISVKALGIGKHVLCERPIGINVSDAQKMVRASEYYPSLIALVNHSLRFLPAYVHLKKSINDGLIGPLSVIDVSVKISSLMHEGKYDWLCSSEMGGGVLNLIGSHVIDLMHFLTGKKAQRVHAIVKTFKQQTESINGIRQITAPDFCNFQMELEGGLLVVANLQSNQYCRNAFEQDVTVVGRDGSLAVAGGDLICMKRKGNDTTGEFKEEKLYVEVQDLRTDSPSSSLPRPYIKGMTKMVGALKEAFATSSGWAKEAVSSAANFNDALYVQAVLEAIRKSSENRMWMKIDMNEIQT